MNESFVTVCGNLVADPQGRTTKSGKPFASFRVASTSRRWDPSTRGFVDGSTNFVNVVGFNALGANIMGSLTKGDPVVVYGRLRVNQYVSADGRNMTSIEVDAHGVGHDLTRGQSHFTRASRPQFESHDRLADPAILESFDAFTGEVTGPTASGGPEGDPFDDEREPGDLEVGDLEPGDLERADLERGHLDPTSAAEAGSRELLEEDADTDPYVVATV